MFGARPTYFVTRPDGTRTALVEVDQLPASIKIAGIPANLPANDAYDMTCVGNRERAPFQYIIEIAAANNNNNPSDNPNTVGKEQPQPPPPSPPPQLSRNGEDREPRNGLGKNKAQVSLMIKTSFRILLIFNLILLTFDVVIFLDRTTDYIGAKQRLSLLVPLLLSQLRSCFQLR